jgi:hypothetical protein
MIEEPNLQQKGQKDGTAQERAKDLLLAEEEGACSETLRWNRDKEFSMQYGCVSSEVCNGVNDRWTQGGSPVTALNQLVLGGSGSSRDLQRQSDEPHLRE